MNLASVTQQDTVALSKRFNTGDETTQLEDKLLLLAMKNIKDSCNEIFLDNFSSRLTSLEVGKLTQENQ